MGAALTDYSQSGEQEAILELAAGLPVGRFLDIGAGDGVSFSNTRALAEAGWGGVAVEPAAWAFDKLAALYAASEDVTCVSAVVTGRLEGLVPWHYTSGDHLSTTVAAEAARWPTAPFVATYAAAVTLSELLALIDLDDEPPSVVSIDAEGLTDELVRAYLRDDLWPGVRVLCHEHVEQHRTLRRMLTGDGLELVLSTANNLIWWRP